LAEKALAALAIGLIIGMGIGLFAGHPPVTFRTVSYTTSTLTETATKLATTIKTVTTTMKTTYTTFRETTTTTFTKTIYPAETPEILLTERGKGNKETKPFTVENETDLHIIVTLRAVSDPRNIYFSFGITRIKGPYKAIGRITGEEGVFEFYVREVAAGNYYLEILSNNCEWEVVVKKVF